MPLEVKFIYFASFRGFYFSFVMRVDGGRITLKAKSDIKNLKDIFDVLLLFHGNERKHNFVCLYITLMEFKPPYMRMGVLGGKFLCDDTPSHIPHHKPVEMSK